MTQSITSDQLRYHRLIAQRLARRADPAALVDVVRAVIGVQGQLTPAMMLALRARVAGLEMEEVHAAIADARSVARSWLMRGTLHLSAAEDVRWLTGILGPVFMAGGKARRLQLGLDDAAVQRGIEAIGAMLSPGEVVTRDVIVARLNARGFTLDRKTQAPIHLIGQAALAGVIVLGPEEPGAKSTYTLAEGWLPQGAALVGDAALAHLARRYVTGYGPAGAADFAAWSGLPAAGARLGWDAALGQGEWAEVSVDGRALWLDAPDLQSKRPGTTMVSLLPAFDTYVLGYKQRQDLVAPEHQAEVYHGGQTVPVVMVDGLAAGVWRYERGARRFTISVRAFGGFDAAARHLIEAEAEDIARFVDMPAVLEIS